MIVKLHLEDSEYPHLLREISDPPRDIYYLGQLPQNPCIAIVGTRKATSGGKLIAKKISKELAQKGFVIVSGLALGIDAAAHEGALAGRGKTVAVLAGGVKNIYPKENYQLAQNILQAGGALVSEYEDNNSYYAGQFLRRNRIISGLSVATVVVEAPIRSGSLVTAKYALDQGRDVFVVPGPADHPNYAGSHMLIRNGARLVTSAEEILNDLAIDLPSNEAADLSQKENHEDQEENQEENEIIKALAKATEPLTVDNIVVVTKLEPYIVNRELAIMVIKGRVFEKQGKFYIKK